MDLFERPTEPARIPPPLDLEPLPRSIGLMRAATRRGQVYPHMPLLQVPASTLLQLFPHAPQFAGSDLRSVSQPLDGSASQSAKPLVHMTSEQ